MTAPTRGAAPVSAESKLFGEIDGIKIYNTSYVGMTRKELRYDNSDYAYERDRAINHICDKGVMPMTPEQQDYEKSWNYKLVGKFTMKLLTMDLSHFSFPVAYSEPRSFLERTADLFAFIALAACKPGDAATRLKNLAVGAIAGFHFYLQSKKPWNPIIGETYVGQWPNGVRIYGEQISHHPPVSAFQIYGPNNEWFCYAKLNFTIDSGLTEFTVNQNGIFHLEYPDGTKYEWEFPKIGAVGILMGDRIVRIKGGFSMKELTSGLECKIDTYPKADKKKGLNKTRASSIYGGIFNTSNGERLVELIGDYCGTIKANNEVVWNIGTDFAQRPNAEVPDADLLPSDCRYRLDRNYLIEQDAEKSDLVKGILEDAQRREQKFREHK